MVTHPVPVTTTPCVVAVRRHSFTNALDRMKRRLGNSAPVVRSRKADWDLERLVLREVSRPPLPSAIISTTAVARCCAAAKIGTADARR